MYADTRGAGRGIHDGAYSLMVEPRIVAPMIRVRFPLGTPLLDFERTTFLIPLYHLRFCRSKPLI